jgi:hypothetical protein
VKSTHRKLIVKTILNGKNRIFPTKNPEEGKYAAVSLLSTQYNMSRN